MFGSSAKLNYSDIYGVLTSIPSADTSCSLLIILSNAKLKRSGDGHMTLVLLQQL